jgi:hypothetical protein
VNRTTVIWIVAAVLGALVLYALRDMLLLALILMLPFILIGLLVLGVVMVYRRSSAHGVSTSLAEQLQSQFARNQAAGLEKALSRLPDWPISTRIKATAQELLTLKRSIYRARAEGVPSSLIERYLANTAQAAETVWHLASKVDAIGQNQIDYTVVEGMLQREEQRLYQLQRSIKETHEGIAVVIAAGIQSDSLQTVEEDLSALSQAVKFLQAKA